MKYMLLICGDESAAAHADDGRRAAPRLDQRDPHPDLPQHGQDLERRPSREAQQLHPLQTIA